MVNADCLESHGPKFESHFKGKTWLATTKGNKYWASKATERTRLDKTPSTQKAKKKQEKQCSEEKAHSDPRIFYQKLGS